MSESRQTWSHDEWKERLGKHLHENNRPFDNRVMSFGLQCGSSLLADRPSDTFSYSAGVFFDNFK